MRTLSEGQRVSLHIQRDARGWKAVDLKSAKGGRSRVAASYGHPRRIQENRMKNITLGQSVRDMKADALDRSVKEQIAKAKAADAAKTARLRALRLARDEEQAAGSRNEATDNKVTAKRGTLHLRVPR